jgi:hypothetical protein
MMATSSSLASVPPEKGRKGITWRSDPSIRALTLLLLPRAALVDARRSPYSLDSAAGRERRG